MKYIETTHAPAAVWPYAQAVVHQGIAYLSGQIALDPISWTMVDWGVGEQTVQVLKNIDAVLTAAWSHKDKVLSCSVFLADMHDFSQVNDLYATYFGWHTPARATVAVKALPKWALVEISCITVCK